VFVPHFLCTCVWVCLCFRVCLFVYVSLHVNLSMCMCMFACPCCPCVSVCVCVLVYSWACGSYLCVLCVCACLSMSIKLFNLCLQFLVALNFSYISLSYTLLSHIFNTCVKQCHVVWDTNFVKICKLSKILNNKDVTSTQSLHIRKILHICKGYGTHTRGLVRIWMHFFDILRNIRS
jgi:hypothetical protein